MNIEWKITTAGELSAERVARLLARLILDGEHTLSDVASTGGCGEPRDVGKNDEIHFTQEVSS